MFETSAIFSRKEQRFDTTDCVVEKVIRLSRAEYEDFAANLLRDQDFIRENVDLMGVDDDYRKHCLLVVGEGQHDGILIHSSGYDYARYAAFVPNADGLLTVGRYPALADLNKKLTDITDAIVEQTIAGDRAVVNLLDLETDFGIDLMINGAVRQTVLGMLNERPEVADWELDKNELILFGAQERPAETLSDPTVSQTDMYAYGYDYDGMIPLGKARALELFDKGHEVYLLYPDNTEGEANDREEMESFDGMFGIEDVSQDIEPLTAPVEVFVLNREKYEKDIAVGEWLKLPATADALHELLERIGVERPSEGAFSITAVRVQYESMRDYVSKYDSLDELNMLASYMHSMEDYEHGTLQAILTSGVVDVGTGTAALINLLDADNMNAFDITDADDAKALGEYWQGDKPDGISIEDYGKQLVAEEKGKFTEWGYINFRHKELTTEYNGVVPDEYKIVDAALYALRTKAQERSATDKKPSVLEQLREARQTPRPVKEQDAPHVKKDKGGPEL